MLGYMTVKEAIGHGFTNHASYYGIPVYVSDDEDFMVAKKWFPMEYLMSVFHVIEGFIGSTFFPEREPSFMFKVYGRLDGE